jgi:hemerythrin
VLYHGRRAERQRDDVTALIVWNSDYDVGVDRLDADHIMIFSLINHIHDAHESGVDETAIGRILGILIDLAQAHFQREEALIRQKDYAYLAQHTEAHADLLEQLGSLHAAYEKTASPEISLEIVELLSFWLESHILEMDMDYKAVLGGATG